MPVIERTPDAHVRETYERITSSEPSPYAAFAAGWRCAEQHHRTIIEGPELPLPPRPGPSDG